MPLHQTLKQLLDQVGKVIKPTKYKNYALLLSGLITSQFVLNQNNEFTPNQAKQVSFFKARLEHKLAINTLVDGRNNGFEPLIFQADQSSNDTLCYGQAMKARDAKDFKKAMKNEVNDLKEAEVYELTHLSENPKDRKLIKFIRSFKRKRTPLGTLIKHNARLCAHRGMQQKGVDHMNTFSPVVNWSTIRFLLNLSIKNGWCARHVDCVLAFSQADCDTDVYLSPPLGFNVNNNDGIECCVKLNKNLYGACQASSN